MANNKPIWEQMKDKVEQSGIGEGFKNAFNTVKEQAANSFVQNAAPDTQKTMGQPTGTLNKLKQSVSAGAQQGTQSVKGTPQFEGMGHDFPDTKTTERTAPGGNTYSAGHGVVYEPGKSQLVERTGEAAAPTAPAPTTEERKTEAPVSAPDPFGIGKVDLSDPNYFFNAAQKRQSEENRLKADAEFTRGLNEDLIPFEQRNLAEKEALIRQSAEYQLQNLSSLEALSGELLAKKQDAIAKGEKAQLTAVENAYQANQAEIDIARERTRLANQEIQNLQQLANKKAQLQEEAVMARFGSGSFTGFKNIQETILRGEEKVLNLKKEADLDDRELTQKTVDLNRQYQGDVQEIAAWKADSMAKVYDQYYAFIESIKTSKNMTAKQKTEAIINAKDKANQNIGNIMQESIKFQYEAAYKAEERADQISAEKIEAVERARKWEQDLTEEAKVDMELLLKNYVGQDFNNLEENVKRRFEEVEREANLPSGFMEQALTRMNEEALDDSFEWHGVQTDANGSVTAIGIQNGTPVAVSLGKIGKESVADNFSFESAGGQAFKFNKKTGEYEALTPSDYDDITNSVTDVAVGDKLGQEISKLYPDGSYGGQCGAFLWNFIDMSSVKGGRWGDLKSTKQTKMNMSAEQVKSSQVGDVILTNEHSKYGHMLMVVEDLGGTKKRVIESNRLPAGGEKVSSSRVIDMANPGNFEILGGYRGPMKPEFESMKKEIANDIGYQALDSVTKFLSSPGESILSGLSGLLGGGGKSSDMKSVNDVSDFLYTEYGKGATTEEKNLLKRRGQEGIDIVLAKRKKAKEEKEDEEFTPKSAKEIQEAEKEKAYYNRNPQEKIKLNAKEYLGAIEKYETGKSDMDAEDLYEDLVAGLGEEKAKIVIGEAGYGVKSDWTGLGIEVFKK